MSGSSEHALVPTNLITGFLGAGKTTALVGLLTHRPPGERWAVLVNEFGSVGLDGALLEGAAPGVAVREVAGGCICCSARVALRVGLTKLLRDARPHRLLIEPTGLGHPTGIFDVLAEPHLARVLELRSTICLVDPRRFDDSEFADNATARDQMSLADVLVANKTDLAGAAATARFIDAARALFPPKRAVVAASFGRFDPALLDIVQARTPQGELPRRPIRYDPVSLHPHGSVPGTPLADARGWIFPAAVVFDARTLKESIGVLLASRRYERVKGVFRIGRSWVALNYAGDAPAWVEIAYRRDSRLEAIAVSGSTGAWEDMGAALERAHQCQSPPAEEHS